MITTDNNPLLKKYQTPFDTPPFDLIKNKHYEPAFDEAIKQLQIEVDHIANNEDEPTFENTVVAFERSGILLDKVNSVFFNVLNTENNDEMMEISQRISPKLSESSNNIYLNKKLFDRIKTVYNSKNKLKLATEDARLLSETYDSFIVQGAGLKKEEKEKYRQLSTELNLLSLKFEQNTLKDKNRFEMILTDKKDLSGLPESVLDAARTLAKNKRKEGWLFNLSAPSYTAFMRYSDSRDLREKMYREYMSIGNKNDEYDNKEIVKNIVNKRLKIAKLLKFDNYAEYALKHTMAKESSTVYNLLNQLLEAYKPVAINEYNTIQGFASGIEQKNITIMPWDWSYYAEKLKDIRFNVNDEITRPYFELENVKKGVFGLATQLYGITFKQNKKISVYHPEVDVYEIYDTNGDFLAILYTDFHPREGKQSGAWMNSIKPQFKGIETEDGHPQVIIVMNFTRPTETKPSLLSFDEVNTLLHEFGHALHGILSNCKYALLSGTNVYHDFVELPSQIMENWLTEKEYLNQIAIHYQNGKKITQELIQSLLDTSNFNIGYQCCRQISFGLLDMAWHTLNVPFKGDIKVFEKKACSMAQILPDVNGALMSSNFGHIFAGSYAAGYYGYKWAEVLDADAFRAFKDAGIFNKEIATLFRDNILSKGGSEDPNILYRRFRGRDASIDALLIRNGIKK